jgi:(E)-4-hydroxy-3-methylbut-2-enyl-diphosphate synthase
MNNGTASYYTNKRKLTKQIHVGKVAVGGGAPVTVQTMVKAPPNDVEMSIKQIKTAEQLGCDIIRIAIPDEGACTALREIKKQVNLPVVADIHFNHRLAIMAIEAGADGIRINPGNIGTPDQVREIVECARSHKIPIRIGVNSGSLEKEIINKFGEATADALVESALRYTKLIEDMGYQELKISVKSPSVHVTVAAYRKLAQLTNYPLHLGVTEAGTLLTGTVRSTTALALLLAEGIGDTIRVSLTADPAMEVKVGVEILRSLGLRQKGPCVISCPACGRVKVDVETIATKVEDNLERFYSRNPQAPHLLVAIMGCNVNGPGEAKWADVAVAGGNKKFALYIRGKYVRTIEEAEVVDAIMEVINSWQ